MRGARRSPAGRRLQEHSALARHVHAVPVRSYGQYFSRTDRLLPRRRASSAGRNSSAAPAAQAGVGEHLERAVRAASSPGRSALRPRVGFSLAPPFMTALPLSLPAAPAAAPYAAPPLAARSGGVTHQPAQDVVRHRRLAHVVVPTRRRQLARQHRRALIVAIITVFCEFARLALHHRVHAEFVHDAYSY